MTMAATNLLVVCALVLSLQLTGIQAQLSPFYYANTCPNVENIARTTFITQINLLNILSAPASLLRLAFHDCIVDGCEGSVLLNSAPGIVDEKLSGKNLGIGNLNVIDAIKANVEQQCPGVVSCADIVALAGREAVRFAGGPQIQIRLGRRDGLSASASRADNSLPPATATVSEVLADFSRMGLSDQEIVALLGSHTIGVAHCENVENRLYPQFDTTLQGNFLFGSNLRLQCPQGFSNPAMTIANDITNINFDNQYFRDVSNNRGLLSIDDAIGKDPRTAGYVDNFANNRALFDSVFAGAYAKMTEFQVLTGLEGEIRQNCRFVN